jgi:CBS domain-containing protein
MRVAEYMRRGVSAVDPESSIQEAATQMVNLKIGALFAAKADALVGVLTDRDIILRVVVEGRNSASVKVADVMSTTVFSCGEDDTIESVLAEMRERQIRRMPVYNADGHPVGVIAVSDLAKAPAQMQEVLRQASKGDTSGGSA